MFGFEFKWFKWKYRVRDCKDQTIALCETLEQAVKIAEPNQFLINLLQQGLSVTDGHRFKIDVRGAYCDSTWEF